MGTQDTQLHHRRNEKAPPYLTMTTIFHNRELSYDRDMLGALQGGGARPSGDLPLVGGRQEEATSRGLENAMQGLLLSQQSSLLPSSVLPHNLPCLDSLANQASDMKMSEEMEAPTNPAYRQYLADRAEEERRASEAVMPSSMMAHCILPTNQQQQQMQLYQQLGMVQQQQQHQQAGNLHLLQQLGGSSLLTRQPDLVPVLS